jgi:D-xylulose reductase
MAPHIPENVSWDEAGSIQPLAVSWRGGVLRWIVLTRQIGVQIGKRADIRAHQTLAIL